MEKCEHKNYIGAGYFYKHPTGQKDIRIQSMYEVYCQDCHHFVNLLSEEILDDKGLIMISWIPSKLVT